MKGKINAIALTTLLSSTSIGAYAQNSQLHTIISPNCLINSTKNIKVLSRTPDLALFEIDSSRIDQLSQLKHQRKCGGFMDVTEDWKAFYPQTLAPAMRAHLFLMNYSNRPTMAKTQKQYDIHYRTEVEHLLTKLNPSLMWDNLSTLSQFKDRYANSDNGVKAAHWLKSQVETIAKENHRSDVTAFFVDTGSYYKQPSLVVKFGDTNEPGIVIGGHMDTLGSSWGNKPGADDDGSGTVTVLETARNLMSSGMHFKKPIYFIWYAAEEMGLVGSNYVVKYFKHKHIPVDAVMQMDMTGYAHKNQGTMWLIKDNVDEELTNYLETLIHTYVKQEVKSTACGYACSDHASWTQGGFSASMPSESAFEQMNPYIHSSNDTINHLSLDHMTNYAKLATAFAVELAEPVA